MAGRLTASPEQTAAAIANPLVETPSGAFLTLTLHLAANLARDGEQSAALDLLVALGAEKDSSPPALDLLARIHAQKGRYQQAESLWTRWSSSRPQMTPIGRPWAGCEGSERAGPRGW